MANTNAALTALADPTRRAIFERLVDGPRPVGELARGLPVSRPAVSQHLSVLKSAGLVTDRAVGTKRVYQIDPAGLGALRAWLDRFWDGALGSFQAAIEIDADQETQMALTIAPTPVRKSIRVKATQARAFEVFTADMNRWWPRAHKIGPAPLKEAVLEPRAGGRWYEIDEDGSECAWGHVIAWEPPSRLLLAWQINANWLHDPDLVTEVEVRFTPDADGGTRVDLEHRGLERFGEKAEAMHRLFDGEGAWMGTLGEYAKIADAG